MKLIPNLLFGCLLFSLQLAYSQSCPVYDKRNNGNGGGSCSSSDPNNYGIYSTKTGHFTFSSSAYNFTVNKVYYNNTLIQNGTQVLNGSNIFFGNINVSGSSSYMCFYATSGNVGAAPAGYYTFEISANSTTLSCSYGITATNGGGLSTTTPGTIGSDQAICTGGTATTLSSSTNATNYSSYKWQKSTTSSSSGFSDIASTNSATYSPGVLTQTTYFQRIAIDASAIEYASNVVTITVLDAGTISPQPGSTWTGSSTTFSSNGTTGGTWTVTTSPNGIASITSGGVLTATASGSGTVTYSVNSGSTSCTATRNFNIYGTSGSLPVTWESVSAQKKNGQVFLQWATASETNTRDFVVEYSNNAQQWTSLSTIPAAGNSTTTRNYSYVHQNPLKGNNYNYYRILQRDLDDKFSYSKIVSIIFNEPGADLQVYPNPVQDQLTIFLAETQLVRLVNAAGATVWKGQLPAGRNTIPVHTYSKGVYVLTAGMQSQRVLIQ